MFFSFGSVTVHYSHLNLLLQLSRQIANMKGRERNAAFFQQHDDAIVGVAGKKGNTICSNNTNALLKKGRSTGAVLLTEKKFTSIPFGLFTVEQDLEEGEKFWLVQSLSMILIFSDSQMK